MDETDLDELFRVLGDDHRRRLLLLLRENDPDREPIQVPEDVYVGERDLSDLQVEMVHVHLPLLAEKGYVEWNRENHEVFEGPAFDDIEHVLELLQHHREELPWDLL